MCGKCLCLHPLVCCVIVGSVFTERQFFIFSFFAKSWSKLHVAEGLTPH